MSKKKHGLLSEKKNCISCQARQKRLLLLPRVKTISWSPNVVTCLDTPSQSPLSLCTKVCTESFPMLPCKKYSSWFCLTTAIFFSRLRLNEDLPTKSRRAERTKEKLFNTPILLFYIIKWFAWPSNYALQIVFAPKLARFSEHFDISLSP